MIDELLRNMCPDTTPPDSLVTLRARRALLRQALAKRSRRRYVVRALIGTAAAAVVLGVVGVVNLRGTEGGATAAAATLLNQSATTLESAPAAQPGQYTYFKVIDTYWNYGPSADGPKNADTEPAVSSWLESWIPGDPDEQLVQRTTEPDGSFNDNFLPAHEDSGFGLFQSHPADPVELLKALGKYVTDNGTDGPVDNEMLWGAAFSLTWDVQAPTDLKADVLRALTTMDGVAVVDENVRIGDRTGVALGYDAKYAPQLIVDPRDGSFIGSRGFPERDKAWAGPQEPMWTSVTETKIVDSAPQPPQ